VGDYMGVAVGADGVAHPVWTDTRNPIFSPSTGDDVRELVPAGQGTDIYTRALPGSSGEPSILAYYVRSVKLGHLRTEMPYGRRMSGCHPATTPSGRTARGKGLTVRIRLRTAPRWSDRRRTACSKAADRSRPSPASDLGRAQRWYADKL
jgi:hypothetical protein